MKKIILTIFLLFFSLDGFCDGDFTMQEAPEFLLRHFKSTKEEGKREDIIVKTDGGKFALRENKVSADFNRGIHILFDSKKLQIVVREIDEDLLSLALVLLGDAYQAPSKYAEALRCTTEEFYPFMYIASGANDYDLAALFYLSDAQIVKLSRMVQFDNLVSYHWVYSIKQFEETKNSLLHWMQLQTPYLERLTNAGVRFTEFNSRSAEFMLKRLIKFYKDAQKAEANDQLIEVEKFLLAAMDRQGYSGQIYSFLREEKMFDYFVDNVANRLCVLGKKGLVPQCELLRLHTVRRPIYEKCALKEG